MNKAAAIFLILFFLSVFFLLVSVALTKYFAIALRQKVAAKDAMSEGTASAA